MQEFDAQFRGLDEGMWPVRKWFKEGLHEALSRGRKEGRNFNLLKEEK